MRLRHIKKQLYELLSEAGLPVAVKSKDVVRSEWGLDLYEQRVPD